MSSNRSFHIILSGQTLLARLGMVAGLLLIVTTMFTTVGCSTHADHLRQPRQLFYNNNLTAAEAELTTLLNKRNKDRDVLNLDLAMVDLLSGRANFAEERLRKVRDSFDQHEGTDAVEGLKMILSDDQSRSYEGEDYEKILTRVFLAISNLMDDGSDAEAYSLQIHEKQRQLLEKLGKDSPDNNSKNTAAYRPLAIGYYIRGVLREATHHDYDDAFRAYQSVVELCPGVQPLAWDLQRVQTGVHSASGNGVLYVLGLVGRGPVKVESTEQATSDALLVADRIVSAVGKYSIPPTLAPLKVPVISVPLPAIDFLDVHVDGHVIGPTVTVTDIGYLAHQTHQAQMTNIMARAIARRVVKKAAVYVAKDQMHVQSPIASLLMDAAGVAWEATEAADTRCWGLLPREIQVLRVELPAGKHDVQLRPALGSRRGAGSRSSVEIFDGRNTYMLAYFPDSSAIGQPVIGPAH